MFVGHVAPMSRQCYNILLKPWGLWPHIASMDRFFEIFAETSLIWGLGLLLIIAAIYFLRAFLSYRTLALEAPEDYNYKSSQGMLPENVSEAVYIRAYKRYHAPRAPLHVAGVLSAIAALTLPALGLFYWITFTLWEMNGKDKVFAPGLLVHSLLMFFLIILFWTLLAFLTAKNYHRHAPISLQDEIKREML